MSDKIDREPLANSEEENLFQEQLVNLIKVLFIANSGGAEQDPVVKNHQSILEFHLLNNISKLDH